MDTKLVASERYFFELRAVASLVKRNVALMSENEKPQAFVVIHSYSNFEINKSFGHSR